MPEVVGDFGAGAFFGEHAGGEGFFKQVEDDVFVVGELRFHFADDLEFEGASEDGGFAE
ncbi:hypothetical protein KDK_72720 [Dictyobacter kobayashii]|uniref:Uncharacterized protein n=1 Tax=Dictyobacter kobayashii TaxID=2014872 RepID=A0A402AWF9_9CHLR|nr:hypothetical protein KDK_72720 [Dictyobacter kobayashii]